MQLERGRQIAEFAKMERLDYPQRNLGFQFVEYFGKDMPIIFEIIDHGASGDFTKVSRTLKESGMKYSYFNTGEMLREKNRRAREPRYLLNETLNYIGTKLHHQMAVKLNEAQALICFDDWVTSGSTMVGGLVRALEIARAAGIPEVFISAKEDRVGIAHFADKRTKYFTDIRDYLAKRWPRDWDYIMSNDLEELISNYHPTVSDMAPLALVGELMRSDEFEEDVDQIVNIYERTKART